MVIDQNALDDLEYALTRLLADGDDTKVPGFWCDGVMAGDTPIKPGASTLDLIVFTGKRGQERYELALELGDEAREILARNAILSPSFWELILPASLQIDVLGKQIVLSMK